MKSFMKAHSGFIYVYAYVPRFWVTCAGLLWNLLKAEYEQSFRTYWHFDSSLYSFDNI